MLDYGSLGLVVRLAPLSLVWWGPPMKGLPSLAAVVWRAVPGAGDRPLVLTRIGDEGGVRWEGGLCGREKTRVFCDSSRVLHALVVSNPLGAGVAVGRRREGARVQQEGLEA